MHVYYTYYVPTTLVVLSWVWSSLNIRAVPKSEILGFISVSSRTLLALRSLWIIFSLESWWRYKIPRAIPRMISKRFFQFRNDALVWSTIRFCSSVYQILCNSVEICGFRNYKDFFFPFCTYIIKEHKTWRQRFLARRHTKNNRV